MGWRSTPCRCRRAASIAIPVAGASYALNQVVDSSFGCRDGAGGTGIASCLDQSGHPSGASIDTSSTGAHTYTVTATSPDGLSGTASISYTVIGLPTPPVCSSAATRTPAGGGTVTVALSCSAPAGVAVSYRIVSGPSHGTLGAVDQTAGTVSYTSQPGFVGSDSFTFTASDAGGSSSVATASLTVPSYPAPVCANVAATTPAGGGTVSVSLACTGPVGTALSYAIDSVPAQGSLGPIDPSTGAIAYTSSQGFAGIDSFAYQATGPGGVSAPATATITIPVIRPLVTPVTTVTCSPAILAAKQQAICTATVTDPADSTVAAPAGHVLLSSPTGHFVSGGHCQLAATGSHAAACTLVFTATAAGTISITASYTGDPSHPPTAGSTTVASSPVAGHTAAVTASGGVVLIKEGSHYVALKGSTVSVPIGSTLDARKGQVTIATAADGLPASDPRHRLQTGTFSAGIFTIKQQAARRRNQTPPTEVLLQTPPHAIAKARCTRTGPPRKGVVRMLTAVVKGVYRIHGAASTATIHQGALTVTDRCDGTLTTLTKGHATITITNGRHRRHTITLTAGHSYLAQVRLFAAKQQAACHHPHLTLFAPTTPSSPLRWGATALT